MRGRKLPSQLRQLGALTSAGSRQSVRTKCSSVGPPMAYPSPSFFTSSLDLIPLYLLRQLQLLMTRFHGTFWAVLMQSTRHCPPIPPHPCTRLTATSPCLQICSLSLFRILCLCVLSSLFLFLPGVLHTRAVSCLLLPLPPRICISLLPLLALPQIRFSGNLLLC